MSSVSRGAGGLVWLALAAAVGFPAPGRADDARPAAAGVTIAVEADAFVLSNGTITARVAKRTGDLTSLRYRGLEILTDRSGHAGAYWSHDASGGKQTTARVTIDPRDNAGQRGEVSVRGISGGIPMGHGPGAARGGDFPADIEIRYTLGRDDSGIYTSCTFTHQADYPAASMTEARFCAKLADVFDWMTLDESRSRAFPADLHEGDKYIHTAVQFDHPVYGWSSTSKQVGFWLINPSVEYLSGGPTKVEFLCHRDTTRVAAPCVLNYWRSSHYGGAVVAVGQGERWTKVIGPFFLYINSGKDPAGLWRDAAEQRARESARWPYDWASGPDYPRRDERATVRGRLVLKDPQAASTRLPNLLVGLAHAPYDPPVARPRPGGAPPRAIGWQTDAKHYQFWTRGDADGRFEIPNVRGGEYTLYALADGVLGEFARAGVAVEPGRPLDLGTLDWTPVRRGRQVWEIGVPNRNGIEFFKGAEYADPNISLAYATLFPNDVTYTIGTSDFRKDWFFQHVPHNEDPKARAVPYFGVRGNGRATPYAIAFDLPAPPRGKATLRLAICGTGTRQLQVVLNDQPAGQVDRLIGDGAITRHSIQGLWYEREIPLDPALFRQGRNVLKLVVPAGPVNNGIIYDYVRLEVDDPATPTPAVAPAATGNAGPSAKPSLYVAGDSTAANGSAGAIGWGKYLGRFFDPGRLEVVNLARGGRSSRTFITEKLWDRLVERLRPGDFVLIQFGHNDGGPINTKRLARGSLPGLGDESQEIDNIATGRHEVVHTFGWYLRKMIADVKAKGATPILLSLTVRNIWKDGKVERGSGRFGGWTREVARAERVAFVDATKLIADRYESMGEERVATLFPRDHTHTSAEGAELNARLVVSGLKGLRDQALNRGLSAEGRTTPTAAPDAVIVAARRGPARGPGADPGEFLRWLNLPEPGDPQLPSIFLVGDSTVRTGRGDGGNGQFGWGDPLEGHFDRARINVVNRAVGGTGAGTFIAQGYWDRVLALLKPGDFVLIQFGHNDNGSRGALRGVGDETQERKNPATGRVETVHTFGWYLRKYIADARARGATPIVCSLIPRNIWRDGKVARARNSHADWARTVAESEKAPFIDLHERIAQRYDALGPEAVAPLFADARVHTSWAGAVLNAECVVEGLKQIPGQPLAAYLVPADSPAR